MSRRKQSNPKSFKSDLECESSEMVIADDWDTKLADASISSNQSSKAEGVMPERENLRENSCNPIINIPALSNYFLEANCVSPQSDSTSKHSAQDFSEEGGNDSINNKIRKISSMKKELSSPSPPASPGKNSRNDADITFSYRQAGAHFLKNTVDSNTLNTLLRGMPLLSTVLPALQRLAPVSPSALSSIGGGTVCICGVKFSSSSNLEAHKAFYCSHRQGSDEKSSKKEGSQSPVIDEEEDASTPLKCPHCSYTTTQKLSLNGHMSIHTQQEEQLTAKVPSVSVNNDNRPSDRYCSDCDIQFSSFKTFRVHKAHYCQTRHVLKNSKSPVREDSGGNSQSISNLSALTGTNAPQPVLALPTNPVLLLPYSLVAGAQLLPPQFLPQATFLLPNGQMHPLPSVASSLTGDTPILPPTLSPEAVNSTFRKTPVITSSPESLSGNDSIRISKEIFFHKKKHYDIATKRKNEEIPLDLTTKRAKLSIKSDLLNDEEKENMELNVEMKCKLAALKAAGEFEGKLLASPQPSPSDEIDLKLPKSPRTAHILLASASPHSTITSPKPSTSSRSPNRSSPISAAQEALSSLMPGIPIISEMDPLSLANLQCLQNLKNLPTELALKLISPENMFNGINPILSPPVMVKQGEAKCKNCSIVFYKEENLQIHKKHYCPARNVSKTGEEDQTAIEGSSTNSESSFRKSPLRDAPKGQKDSTKILSSSLQYICPACGIRFSSTENLIAHQTYYCLKRDSSGDEGVTKGLWRCPRCKIVMAETMQAAHQCMSPSPTSSHGWKCPCCPVLSPTATAAQKHLETHAGIKAFRCTICGYRGNTLRGMRTHIRMHFEKRTNDLQEENFIACILEDDEHRNRNGTGAENTKLLDSSRLLLENPSLSLIMSEGSLSDKTESPLSCSYCPFVTLIRSSFMQHLAVAHNIGQEPKMYQELKSLLESEQKCLPSLQISERPAKVKESSPTPEEKLDNPTENDSKSPKIDSEPDSPSTSTGVNSFGNDSQNGFCFCQLCNISFTRLESYMAHKRFYCSRPQSTTPPETAVQ